ncbi:cupin domain-containing protein [Microbispora sp. NPDC046933]|uniref:cupin domain-containing protein n=1 Tax=Microbispora sp. NPDC046933 TaxID=3155618 RepID=UPI0033D31CB5
MNAAPRRVVTGHDAAGVSIVLSDGAPPVVRTAPDGALFYEIWNTGAAPAPIAPDEPEPTERSLTVPPDPCGTKIRINVFPPGLISPTHRTQSVDYGIVLQGEVVLVLDGSETVLHAGDVVVQRGTDHRWENRSNGWATMAFILVDGFFTGGLRSLLPPDVLDGLMTDPLSHH